ncbi:hypothetical protein HDU98_006807 [Podochytrium sp. JEL0797]|nr:hypothetical protein HDU98_006807 [Podochytrium sp. JEL0797]
MPSHSLRVFSIGACYQDVILSVDSFPLEDQKLRANSVETRRGGNGANVLQVLAQFSQRNTTTHLETSLVAVLAGESCSEPSESSFILSDLKTNLPNVSLAHCVFRGKGFSEPTAWIISTGTTRTIINHTTLPELTCDEFVASMAPVVAASFANPAPGSFWFHFEGRNVLEMENMVAWLIDQRRAEAEKCSSVDSDAKKGWWTPIDGKSTTTTPSMIIPSGFESLGRRSPSIHNATMLGISPGENALGKRTSREIIAGSVLGLPAPPLASTSTATPTTPHFTISVEFEKPNRPHLDNLLPHANLLFFSKVYAEGRGFPSAPTGFLDNIRRETQPGALLFLTWGEQGCFYLVNDPTKPAQTFHVAAPKIFPVDTIGAGDTFAAGVIYGLGVCGWDIRQAVEFAVRLATAKCAQVGLDGLVERVF